MTFHFKTSLRRGVFALALTLIFTGCTQTNQNPLPSPATPSASPAPGQTLKLASPAFENGQSIPKIYSCDGANISPPLNISGVSGRAKSLILVVSDPDAPAGPFIHWLVFAISPSTERIAQNTVPAGAVVGKNSAGRSTYTGPCPPTGNHHYRFRLMELNVEGSFSSDSTTDDLVKYQSHIIVQTELEGSYQRTKG